MCGPSVVTFVKRRRRRGVTCTNIPLRTGRDGGTSKVVGIVTLMTHAPRPWTTGTPVSDMSAPSRG